MQNGISFDEREGGHHKLCRKIDTFISFNIKSAHTSQNENKKSHSFHNIHILSNNVYRYISKCVSIQCNIKERRRPRMTVLGEDLVK